MVLLLNSLKLILISAWLLFTALGLNLSVPTITNFFDTHVPLTWNLFLTCLRPLYLFLLLNVIILTIAASSRFHHPPPPPPPQPLPPPYYVNRHPLPLPIPEDPTVLVDVKPVVVNGMAVTEEDLSVATESTWMPPQEMTPTEAPTLEEVWKAITEGQARAVMKGSETVKERRRNPMVCATSGAATTTTTLRKEPQLSQDELNRRVEAFIRKFNEEMRLQNKQQSLNRSFHADDEEPWQ